MSTRYAVTIFVNVDTTGYHWFGLAPSHPLAEVATFAVDASDALAAAEASFAIGNKMSDDAEGKSYPLDVRSLSVGDLVRVLAAPLDPPSCFRPTVAFFACESRGWRELPEPANPIVELAGSEAMPLG
jgi:hypothetical protein